METRILSRESPGRNLSVQGEQQGLGGPLELKWGGLSGATSELKWGAFQVPPLCQERPPVPSGALAAS